MKKTLFLSILLVAALSCDGNKSENGGNGGNGGNGQPAIVEHPIKADYADFIGDWIVTGTEHKYFGEWHERTELYTFSYAFRFTSR